MFFREKEFKHNKKTNRKSKKSEKWKTFYL